MNPDNNQEDFDEQQILKLTFENNNLKSRIRGYQSLDKLFRASHEKCKRLEIENQNLKKERKQKNTEFNTSSGKTEKMSSEQVERSPTGGQITAQKQKPSENVTQRAHTAVMQESFTGRLQTNVAVQDDVYSMGQIRASFEEHRNPVPGVIDYTANEQGAIGGHSGLSLSQMGAFPSLGTSSSNTTYRDDVLRSSLENNQGPSENILSVQVKKIGSEMNDSNFSGQLMVIGNKITEQVNGYKNALNEKMKTENQMKLEMLEKDRKLQELRDENTKLINKVKIMEKSNSGNVGRAESSSGMDEWVKVDKNNLSATSSDYQNRPNDMKIREQEIMIQKLSEANRKWDEQWKFLQKQYDSRIASLQERLGNETEQTKDLTNSLETRQQEILKLKETLQKTQTTEMERAEFTGRLREKDMQISQLQQKVKDLTNSGAMYNFEATPAPQMQTSQQMYPDVRLPPVYGVYEDHDLIKKLKDENSALKHQVAACEEDFTRERNDRALAQSDKEQLKSEYSVLKENYRQLEKNHKETKIELRRAKDNLGEVMVENEQLKLTNQQLHTKSTYQMRSDPYRFPVYPPPAYAQAPMMPPYQQQQPYGLYNNYQMSANRQMNFGEIHRPHSSPSVLQQRKDMMADAWNCQWCSYENFPTRTVCEMCGRVQLPGNPPPGVQDIGQQNLMSRGQPVGNARQSVVAHPNENGRHSVVAQPNDTVDYGKPFTRLAEDVSPS